MLNMTIQEIQGGFKAVLFEKDVLIGEAYGSTRRKVASNAAKLILKGLGAPVQTSVADSRGRPR